MIINNDGKSGKKLMNWVYWTPCQSLINSMWNLCTGGMNWSVIYQVKSGYMKWNQDIL